MKEKIYELSFDEANRFLNFRPKDKPTFEKLEKSFYTLQRQLRTNKWLDIVGKRFSWLFIRDLVELDDFEACLSIINEIEHLENPDKYDSLTNDARVFTKGLLGLHYKHYIEGGFIPLQKLYFQPMGRKSKSQKEVERIFYSRLKDSNQKPLNILLGVYKEQIIDHFLMRLGIKDESTIKLKNRLEAEGKTIEKLTGEFFVFYPYKSENYYLALWKHRNKYEQDLPSYDIDEFKKAQEIKTFCQREFPEFSKDIL